MGQHSRDVSIARKKELLPLLEQLASFFKNNQEISKKEVESLLKPIKKDVNKAVDYLRVKKHSVEYSFGISIQHEIDRYFEGLRRNPINQAKYERSKAKWDKLVEKGKSPTWKVVPPYLVDLELTRSNIDKIIDDLIKRYQKDSASTEYNAEAEMIELVDFFKEQASRLVYKVTIGIAKTRALELLKEVGIAEPEIRYKRFEDCDCNW